jgi:hypothetical protein
MTALTWKKVAQFIFSTASLVTGILVAVLIQAVVSSIYDNL